MHTAMWINMHTETKKLWETMPSSTRNSVLGIRKCGWTSNSLMIWLFDTESVIKGCWISIRYLIYITSTEQCVLFFIEIKIGKTLCHWYMSLIWGQIYKISRHQNIYLCNLNFCLLFLYRLWNFICVPRF